MVLNEQLSAKLKNVSSLIGSGTESSSVMNGGTILNIVSVGEISYKLYLMFYYVSKFNIYFFYFSPQRIVKR